jgi:sugar/nucleoside kinase (ribokinase family)
MNHNFDMVVMGDINLDWVGRKPLSFAFADLLTNGVIEWTDIDEFPGGSGLNFARFSLDEGYQPLLIGKIGADPAGIFIESWIKQYGIDPHGLIKAAGCGTGKAFIIRDTNDIRFLVNNQPNANSEFSAADVNRFAAEIIAAPMLYISGYCSMLPSAPRRAAMDRAIEIAQQDARKLLVFDVVPHQIYKIYDFDQFLKMTRSVNILISEVATMRRYLGLGDRSEIITSQEVEQTAEKLTAYYPNFILRYGPSGCDQEYIWNGNCREGCFKTTGHINAIDKRGFGDRIAIKTLREHFDFKPQSAR